MTAAADAPRRPSYGWLRVTRGGTPGPWHVLSSPMGVGVQAFCGSKVTGFVKTQRPDDDPPPDGERRCDGCRRAVAANQPRSWRKS